MELSTETVVDKIAEKQNLDKAKFRFVTSFSHQKTNTVEEYENFTSETKGTGDFNFDAFVKQSGNIKKQLELISENMWCNIVVAKEQKIRDHKCPVKNMGVSNTGWDCNKLTGAAKCFSGLTGFYQSNGMQCWQCRKCNYDLCEKCMKVDMLMGVLSARDD